MLWGGGASCAPNQGVKYDDFRNITTVYDKKCAWDSIQPEISLCLKMSYVTPGKWTDEEIDVNKGDFYRRAKIYATWEFYGNSWLFVNRIDAKINGRDYLLSGELYKREISNYSFREWGTTPVNKTSSQYAVFYKALRDGEYPDGIPVRVTGENYYADFLIK